ncbi:hypothetical protein HC891_03540 [Candidatus Gracilibacteria bacterium]|nr:hypothetical protein [Candidatus Gracilibacteria bacterium]
MSEAHPRLDTAIWENMTPEQVLSALVYELYNPVSLLGSQLKRLTEDDDPLTEEEYEVIFSQMHAAVNQLSRTVVSLKRYSQDHPAAGNQGYILP